MATPTYLSGQPPRPRQGATVLVAVARGVREGAATLWALHAHVLELSVPSAAGSIWIKVQYVDPALRVA
jgi:hypothetical protein